MFYKSTIRIKSIYTFKPNTFYRTYLRYVSIDDALRMLQKLQISRHRNRLCPRLN
jgi:hypothetical protein